LERYQDGSSKISVSENTPWIPKAIKRILPKTSQRKEYNTLNPFFGSWSRRCETRREGKGNWEPGDTEGKSELFLPPKETGSSCVSEG
jgi:hypothetical protein